MACPRDTPGSGSAYKDGAVLFGLVIVVVVGQGGPPNIWRQPTPVQLELAALGLMLLGLVLGWVREGRGDRSRHGRRRSRWRRGAGVSRLFLPKRLQSILSAPSSVTHSVASSVTLTVEEAHGNVVTGSVGAVHSAFPGVSEPKEMNLLSQVRSVGYEVAEPNSFRLYGRVVLKSSDD
jgi:hypothetical protein